MSIFDIFAKLEQEQQTAGLCRPAQSSGWLSVSATPEKSTKTTAITPAFA